MNKREHILQVNIDNDGGNGAFSLIRNYYNYLSDEYIFDYFTMGKFIHDSVYSDIRKTGGKCYSANLRKNKLIGHIMLPFAFYKCLKKNDYKIVHIHSEVAYKHFLYGIAAKFAGCPFIIIHSHSNNIDGDRKGVKLLFHRILKQAVNNIGDYFLACSSPAAEWMFSHRNLCSSKFAILQNGIVPSKYEYNEIIRKRVRLELNIDDYIVIGHVGALKKVKNQAFLIDVINSFPDKDKYKLLLIGDGEDKYTLVKRTKELNCEDQVLFLGNRTDVCSLLQGLDVFVFPSIFEGIPIAMLEAQAVGLPVIASDTINNDVVINENVKMLSIGASIDEWKKNIQLATRTHMKMDGYKNVLNSKYNLERSAQTLGLIYKGFYNREKCKYEEK